MALKQQIITMSKYLLVTLLFFQSGFAAITASVDRNPVALNETINLTITRDQIGFRDTLDVSALNRDFTILTQNASSEIVIVNGKRTQKSQWLIALVAKTAGVLTIPAFKIGNEASAAIRLTVNAATDNVQPTTAPVFLETKITPQHSYSGNIVNYTVKLFSQSSLEGQLTPPQIDSIMFNVLGKAQQYQVQRQDKTYNVMEQHYTFLPQKTGLLHIPGAVFNGIILPRTSNYDSIFRRLGGGQTITVSAPAVTLAVKALPANVAFAATEVKLHSHWESSPSTWGVGQALTRVLNLQAKGSGGEQLPSISGDGPAEVGIYPGQPQLNTRINGDEIEGEREEKVVYIAKQSGQIILPKISFKWLNSATGKINTASLPAETYTVTAATATAGPALHSTPSPAASSTATTGPTKTAALSKSNRWLWLAVVVMAELWILTMLLWWRSQRRVKKIVRAAPPMPVSLPQIRRALRQACQQNDAKQLQRTVLQWARCIWPAVVIRNLGEVAALDISPLWRVELQRLSSALYTNGSYVDGNRFWLAFSEQEKYRPATKAPHHTLPPLHPE